MLKRVESTFINYFLEKVGPSRKTEEVRESVFSTLTEILNSKYGEFSKSSLIMTQILTYTLSVFVNRELWQGQSMQVWQRSPEDLPSQLGHWHHANSNPSAESGRWANAGSFGNDSPLKLELLSRARQVSANLQSIRTQSKILFAVYWPSFISPVLA